MALPDIFCRPYHVAELIIAYDTGGALVASDAISALATLRTSAKTSSNTRIDTEDTNLGTARTAAKTACDTAIDNEATAVTNEKNTAKTDSDNAIQALIDTPPADEAGWLAAMATLKTTMHGYFDSIAMDNAALKTAVQAQVDTCTINASGAKTDIQGYIDTVTTTKEAVLTTVKSDYEALIQSEGRTYICPQCAADGRKSTYNADGSIVAANSVESELCDGYGYTETQKTLNPNTNTYIDAP